MLDKYSPLQNRLLRLLSTKAQSKLFTQLKLEKMPSGKVLFETGQVVNHVYFPLDCIVSSLCTLRDGNSAEIYLTGNDGIVGLASIIDSERAICRSVVQSAGVAYQLEMSIIKQAFTQDSEVRTPLLLYALCFMLYAFSNKWHKQPRASVIIRSTSNYADGYCYPLISCQTIN